MRGIAVCLILLAAVLAGCADAPDSIDDGPVDNAPAVLPAGLLAHRAGDVRIDAGDGLGAALANLTAPVGGLGLIGFHPSEPTLGVTSDGTLVMSNAEGSAATGWSSIVRSKDQGATWEDITPSIGPVNTPPTTFDPYVHVDQLTDRIFNLDMEGLNCNYIQWSDDGGDSFTGHAVGCGQPPVLDHPTLFTGPPRLVPTVGYDDVVYLCVNRVADASCATSFDGGLSFDAFRPVFTAGDSENMGVCGGLAGHGTTDPDGRAYWGKVQCGVPSVAVSEDDGLTWKVTTVSEGYTSTRHDVEVASDSAGNIYALWSDNDFDLRMAVSRDHGASWGPAMLVAAPGVETAVFPAIAAGDEGKVAIVYYGTDDNNGTSDIGNDVAWTAYLATIPDALAEDPLVLTSALSDDPIARGPCDDDNRCNGVGDFIDIVIDMDGRPWAALIDVCHDDCDAESGNDRSEGAIGTILEGFPLRGTGTTLPDLPW